MKRSINYPAATLKRFKLLALLFMIIGLSFLIHGGTALFEIYNHEHHIIVIEQGLSPEKGRLWVECLTGMSILFIGIALSLKASMEKKKNR